jgi:hypothetical protein
MAVEMKERQLHSRLALFYFTYFLMLGRLRALFRAISKVVGFFVFSDRRAAGARAHHPDHLPAAMGMGRGSRLGPRPARSHCHCRCDRWSAQVCCSHMASPGCS